MSPFLLFAALVMRYRWLPGALRPSRLYDTALWLSVLAIAGVGAYSIWIFIGGEA